jgi:hypothetical protein
MHGGGVTYTVHEADVLEALRAMDSDSYHGALSDPPYGLTTDGGKTGFMGHAWDKGVPPAGVWREVLRVLKPGAYLLAFGGTRTFHRLTCAIEDAGFEIRDCMMWLYGCLSDDTEVLVDGTWQHWSAASAGRLTLCYDVERDAYSWQAIEEVVSYDYDDTAYRITSERTDQIVSRNHRCIVDRGRGWEFVLSERAARESAATVPIIGDVRGLLSSLEGSTAEAAERAKRRVRCVCSVLEGRVEAERVAAQGEAADVLERVQREGSLEERRSAVATSAPR